MSEQEHRERQQDAVAVEDGDEYKPIEGPQTEHFDIVNQGDPERHLEILERKADLAPRYKTAINQILVSQTFKEDWTQHGDTMCLSSAGSERVARLFSIRTHDVKHHKEEFTDNIGRGYRYIYEGQASMEGRTVYAQGAYSTRDKFLGYANGEWKPVEDINECHIRNAAYHIFLGNCVKALLGLRHIPVEKFEEIMGHTGQQGQAKSVRYGKGTQGGTTKDVSDLQRELTEACLEIARAGYTVTLDDRYYNNLELASEADDRSDIERGKEICKAITTFKNKKGKVVKGDISTNIKSESWLENACKQARKLVKNVQKDGE